VCCVVRQVQALVVSAAQALAHDSAGDVRSNSSSSPRSSAHGTAAHLLSALDVGGDGAVSRRDMLLAFRRDRQLAGVCVVAWQACMDRKAQQRHTHSLLARLTSVLGACCPAVQTT
jgi:hypothetical protein